MDKPRLKPCPFCGGEAKIAPLLGRWCVACTRCPGAVIRTYGDKKEDMIWFWNRRSEAIAKGELMQAFGPD